MRRCSKALERLTLLADLCVQPLEGPVQPVACSPCSGSECSGHCHTDGAWQCPETGSRASAVQQQKETAELRAQLSKLQHVSEQLHAATTRAAANEKRAKSAEWDLEVG